MTYDCSLGTPVVHRCELADGTIHAVLAPAHPTATPLTDLRDGGFRVLTLGVAPGEVTCEAAESFTHCEQVLIRPRTRG